MYVKIGPYLNFIGPYQIAEKLLFWMDKNEDLRVHKFGTWLAGKGNHDTKLTKLCQWIHNHRKRKVKVVVHEYDYWSADATLTPIILPLLKKLKAAKHGSGYIDMEDVPEHMRATETEEWDSQSTFDFYKDETDTQKLKCDVHTRYEWALDEMIWAFEQLNDDDSENQFWIEHGEIDWDAGESEDKTTRTLVWKKPSVVNWDGLRNHQTRVQNGLRLFGKYFSTLWD